ncbi:esterase [Arsukibacterium ikkense]|uniref:Esterase n=1 Tax=Arsukibacterium ikkense TaxID=336831 RepID=A0A0M2V6V6_9GAMM|nr:YqiA/YcfP family alpha/beta fold hydrolase [Arsukibacterium ikkense]KKO46572.1 esterase [Arsukibacterium ikkense]
MIIFIHGFGSDGHGSKATLLRQYCAEHNIPFIAPSLSTIPDLAISTLEELIEQWQQHEQVKLIGSSLGGFYAMYLANKYSLPVVLINPSMAPVFTLSKKIGQGINFHDFTSFEWSDNHVQSLDKYQCSFSGQHCLLLVQTGDDVLDYKLAVDKLPDAKQVIEQGGNHGFEGFERYVVSVVKH